MRKPVGISKVASNMKKRLEALTKDFGEEQLNLLKGFRLPMKTVRRVYARARSVVER